MARENKQIIVLGAGIVGVATALHLQQRGFSVTLIDRAGPGEATSFGSAGAIVPSSLVPMLVPGLWRQLPAKILDPDGPLSLDFIYILRHAGWFAKYCRHGTASEAQRIADGLAGLTLDSLNEHLTLTHNTAAAPWVKASDLLYIYPDRTAFASESFSFQARAERGIDWSEISADELRELEPDLSSDFRFAIRFPKHGIALSPIRLVKELAAAFAEKGGEIIRDDVQRIVAEKREIITSSARRPYDALVVAAGVWSAKFAKQVGVDAPLISERGYHVFFRAPEIRHYHALRVHSGLFIATPMDGGTRLAGIVEFKALEAPPDARVLARLKRHARRLFPSARLDDVSEWLGHRPSLPDSLPIIGRAPKYPDIFLAFGHQHIGLTTAPKTGKLIAQLAAGEQPEIDLTPFAPERFTT